MRAAREFGWLMDGDKVVGINLGADYCAEHEWGIKSLKRQLAIDPNEIGIEARKIQRLKPEDLRLVDTKITKYGDFVSKAGKAVRHKTVKAKALIFCEGIYWSHLKPGEYVGSRELQIYGDKTMATAWDEGSFGILVEEEHFDKLQQIYDAFLRMDISVWLGGGGVFQNAGLVVAITSNVPEASKKTMRNADLDRFALEEAHKRSGIEEELTKAGKRWFALSPRWKDSEKTELVWWLNPMEQHIHEFGWFDINDLRQWAKNEGPCMKKGRKRA